MSGPNSTPDEARSNRTFKNLSFPCILVEGWDDWGFFKWLLKTHNICAHVACYEGKNNLPAALDAIALQLQRGSGSQTPNRLLLTADADDDRDATEQALRDDFTNACKRYATLKEQVKEEVLVIAPPQSKGGTLDSLIWTAIIELDYRSNPARHVAMEEFVAAMQRLDPTRPGPDTNDPQTCKAKVRAWLSIVMQKGRLQDIQHFNPPDGSSFPRLVETKPIRFLVDQLKTFFP